MKQPYNTALYMRLSRDDENYGDSVSIETQRTILQQYARENGLHIIGEYVDDGWSGTNFERPSFQRMMDDIEAGKINCIVTKDLSRFGREHVMMDYYLEFVFPEKQIRYIAVTDNEDTEKGLSDFVPFKNLFNEWFAKYTSRKVKTALRAKYMAGQRTFAYAPLGYIRHPEIKNALAVDEETRWIIERIYDLAVHGSGAALKAREQEKSQHQRIFDRSRRKNRIIMHKRERGIHFAKKPLPRFLFCRKNHISRCAMTRYNSTLNKTFIF